MPFLWSTAMEGRAVRPADAPPSIDDVTKVKPSAGVVAAFLGALVGGVRGLL